MKTKKTKFEIRRELFDRLLMENELFYSKKEGLTADEIITHFAKSISGVVDLTNENKLKRWMKRYYIPRRFSKKAKDPFDLKCKYGYPLKMPKYAKIYLKQPVKLSYILSVAITSLK